MNQEPKQAVVPVEPTVCESCKGEGSISYQNSPSERFTRSVPCEDCDGSGQSAAPQQQGEPVYLLEVDKKQGLYEFVKPEHVAELKDCSTILTYYTHTPSYDQGFAEGIEAAKQVAVKLGCAGRSILEVEREIEALKLKPTTSIQDTSQAKPTDTITMSRDGLAEFGMKVALGVNKWNAPYHQISDVELKAIVSKELEEKG